MVAACSAPCHRQSLRSGRREVGSAARGPPAAQAGGRRYDGSPMTSGVHGRLAEMTSRITRGEGQSDMSQKIGPNLWFDTQAEEAAPFSLSVFPNSTIVSVARYTDAGPGRRAR